MHTATARFVSTIAVAAAFVPPTPRARSRVRKRRR